MKNIRKINLTSSNIIRPLACIGITMLVALAVVFYLGALGVGLALGFCAFAVLNTVLFKSFKPYRAAAVLISVVVLFSVGYINLYSYLFNNLSNGYDNRSSMLEAVVNNIPYKNNGVYRYNLTSSKIDGLPAKLELVLFSKRNLHMSYGQRFRLKVKLTAAKSNYAAAYGINLYAYPEIDDILFGWHHHEYDDLRCKKLSDESGDVRYLPVFIRERLTEAVKSLASEPESGFCNAVIFGDKYGLDNEIYTDCAESGMSYIIVVSGMHLSIIAGAFLFLLRKIGRRRRDKIIRFILCSLVIMIYMAVTGFYPSVVRSGIMITLSMLGRCIYRRSDKYNNLGFAAMCILLQNPLSVCNVGVMMSFGAVFGIFYFYPKLSKRYKKHFYYIYRHNNQIINLNEDAADLNRRVRFKAKVRIFVSRIPERTLDYIAVSLSATIMIIPITLLFFGKGNPFVIVTSVLVSPVVAVLMICGLLVSVVFCVPFVGAAAYLFAFVAEKTAWWIISVIRLSASIPFTRVYIEPILVLLWIAVIFVFVYFVKVFGKSVRWRLILCILTVVIVSGVPCYNAVLRNKTELTVLDSGNGLTAFVNVKGNCSLISCGGSRSYTQKIISELHYSAFDLNRMIIPQKNQLYSCYESNIANEFDVNEILVYYRAVDDASASGWSQKNDCRCFTDGEFDVDLGGGLNDHIISKDNSVWQYIDGSGVSVLITCSEGDINTLPERYRTADYIILCGEDTYLTELYFDKLIRAGDTESSDGSEARKGTISIDLRSK